LEASISTRSGTTPRRLIAGIRTPLLRHQPDARLLELTRRGNEAAFETLFHRYRTRLIAFAHQLLGASSTDAEDVVQEVMVAANHAMVADERAIEVRPWLYKITRNRCLNHLRDQAAARRPPVNGDGHDQELLDRAPSMGPSAAEQADRQADLRLLVEDVCALPEAQRTALVLREIDGLSYQEVADATDTTVSSVKSLLVRARLGLIDIAEGRELSCEDVRISLALAEQKLGGLTGPERAHVRSCERCCEVKKRLRGTTRSLAALAPVGLLGPVQDALGSAAVAGGAGAAAGGGAAAIGGGGAAAGGILAGGGLAAKGVITALVVGVVAAGSSYIPGIGGKDSGSATPAAPAATGQPAPSDSAPGPLAGGSDTGKGGEGGDAANDAATVGAQGAQAAVSITDSSPAASLEAPSRERGSSPTAADSRDRPGEVVVAEPVPTPEPVAAPPAADEPEVDPGPTGQGETPAPDTQSSPDGAGPAGSTGADSAQPGS
jgi:RNA polymerase sigma factor (sigma-70 family)